MPDTAVLKIFNINIDSIQTAKEECNTNIGDAKESDTKQEAHVMEESCRNIDSDLKIDNNVNGHNYANVNVPISYFPSSPNVEADKRKKYQANMKSTQCIW